MNRVLRIVFFAAVAAVVAAPHTPFAAVGEGAGTTVDLVYHSDTRGYFLPCG